jgi:16S rRNA (cytosine1402-N4)-methyltransferase
MKIYHTPIMVEEICNFFDEACKNIPNPCIIDCTIGEGGHSECFLKKWEHCHVLGIDRDPNIIKVAKQRLEQYQARVTLFNSNFDELSDIITDIKQQPAAILVDLGISSYHYEASQRGFSFNDENKLQMNLDDDETNTAEHWLNTASLQDIIYVLKYYGEERFAKKIADTILKERKLNQSWSGKRLANLISNSIPKKYWKKNLHPATKSFMAIRIAINKELTHLETFLDTIPTILPSKCKLAMISFHSLEDRMVKTKIKELSKDSGWPEEIRKSLNEKPQILKQKKGMPITPKEDEASQNPRARSAKLRLVEIL